MKVVQHKERRKIAKAMRGMSVRILEARSSDDRPHASDRATNSGTDAIVLSGLSFKV